MNIVIVVFEGITALDAIGPYEVLSRLPSAEVRFVAAQAGAVRTDEGSAALIADHSFEDVTDAEILLVPGGLGTRSLLHDEDLAAWLRGIHETTRWTTSVCTGSLLLGAAGILDGLRATTHWASLERLREFGAEPVRERVVRDGRVISAAGVSSGIDMALTLVQEEAGTAIAQAIQLAIEYDPNPPVDAGSPATAPPEIVERVTAAARRAAEPWERRGVER